MRRYFNGLTVLIAALLTTYCGRLNTAPASEISADTHMDLELHRQAMVFATALPPNGMGMNRAEALNFADTVAQEWGHTDNFLIYTGAFTYAATAITQDGLGMNVSAARAFADMAVNQLGSINALQAYQSAVRFARLRRPSGLGLDTEAGMAFADFVLAQIFNSDYLRDYKTGYAYAQETLHFDYLKAREFTQWILGMGMAGAYRIELHGKATRFARSQSPSGLALSETEALLFANKAVTLLQGEEILDRYRTIYEYALTPVPHGLGMSPAEAKAYASKHSGWDDARLLR